MKIALDRNCQVCNKVFSLNPRLGTKWAEKTNRGKYCGRECYYKWRRGKHVSPSTEFKHGAPEDHPRWKGGIETTRLGYRKIYKPNHPKAHRGKVFEHRLVMEETLGRSLDDAEVVHHLNGIKSDNHPDNLMVFSNNGEHMKYERRNRF